MAVPKHDAKNIRAEDWTDETVLVSAPAIVLDVVRNLQTSTNKCTCQELQTCVVIAAAGSRTAALIPQ